MTTPVDYMGSLLVTSLSPLAAFTGRCASSFARCSIAQIYLEFILITLQRTKYRAFSDMCELILELWNHKCEKRYIFICWCNC